MEIYKNIKEIRDSIKQIKFECQKLKKDIKKKEEDSKLFKISTVVLKKYNFYLYNNLINISNNHFDNIFMYSCGILFTSTIFEDVNKKYSSLINSNFSNLTRHEQSNKINEYNTSLVNIKNEKMLFQINNNLEKKKRKKYKENNKTSSKKKKVYNKNSINYSLRLNNYEKSIESVKSEDMKSEGKNTSFNIKEKNNSVYKCKFNEEEKEEESDNESDKIVNNLKEKMYKKNYEDIRNKKKKKKKKTLIQKLNGNFYDDKEKKSYNNFSFGKTYNKKEEIELNLDSINNNSDITDIIVPNKDNFLNFNKNYSYNFSQMNNTYGEKQITDDKDYKMKFSSNESSKHKSFYSGLYRNKSFYEKKKINNKSYIDLYVDIIKNGKVFSFFENKKKEKNTFEKFVNQIKNIFFINENKDNQLKNIEKKKDEFNILKYQCLIKSRKMKIYLCVCPNCSKNFYLLIKKSSNKKLISKVFHPSHFSSLVNDLRKQKTNIFNEQNKKKSESFCLDINSVEYFYEEKCFNENNFDFCNCYSKIEKTNNFFDNLDILLYI
ncbi:conserved Plasmodium protein, unknown function [Plasmodium gallinaceum]|uniref:Uncharacterized protein n=1 Tax=Plasmodium gallinaceum TaxID=5849 RepID=A0A1J1GMB0_PLAGA|nr:conserved Plasmodium protein, unknown function [Plasmodium gallinaceum]CRG93381.1 conserved Plasmodium protein, unknown function [Plasmodium gallinaceum]